VLYGETIQPGEAISDILELIFCLCDPCCALASRKFSLNPRTQMHRVESRMRKKLHRNRQKGEYRLGVTFMQLVKNWSGKALA
jgi:hypothetical protein